MEGARPASRVVSFLLALLGPGGAAAQDPPAVAAAELGPGEMVSLDGVLDEPLWQRIPAGTGFLQQEPRGGEPATEQTEVRVAYDPHALYLGVVLHDREPDRILAFQRARDGSLSADDRFMWILDTFRDGRTGYFFEINPAGLMGDGLIQPGGGAGSVDKAWDGVWEARVARGAHGWSAEVRIPFRTLNFDPSLESWGINFQRTVRRTGEESVWTGFARNQGLMRPNNAGRLTGLRGISQGLGLEARPYLKAGASSAPARGDPGWTTPRDVGVDLSYSITPSLRASVTVNTDFAETEVDQRQVNLTRFPLRFPEKRDFFLEGSSVFTFARPIQIFPYFSRRVGLVSGEPVPVQAGARLTGQAGAYDLGLLQLRTDDREGSPGEDFTVARVVRRLFRQSSAGVLYTRRAATDAAVDAPRDRHTLALDWDLFTSRFRRNQNLQLRGYAMWNSDPFEDSTAFGDRMSFGAHFAYPNNPFSAYLSVRQSGSASDPAVGFTERNGFRRFDPNVSYTPLVPGSRLVRSLRFHFRTLAYTDFDLDPQSVTTTLVPLEVRFVSGATAGVEARRNLERLDSPFAIHPGVVLPVGRYTFGEVDLYAATPEYRAVSASATTTLGQFWSGARERYSLTVVLRPTTGVSVAPELDRNRVRLDEGDFSTTVLRLATAWDVSPFASLATTAQYDDVSETLGLFSRVRWTIQPGSELFVVYTHNWRTFEERRTTLDRTAVVKLVYTYRL